MPISSARNGGVSMVKLADGSHLFAFMNGGLSGDRETHFYRFEGSIEAPSSIEFLGKTLLSDALAHSSSSRVEWEGTKYPENMSMITECGTGHIYSVHFGAANATLDGNAVIHLARIEPDDTGAPAMRTVQLYKVQEDDDSCWYRGGASAGSVDYWEPGTLRILCHERVTINGDFFSFQEGSYDESVN
jgi:hypothetical protein